MNSADHLKSIIERRRDWEEFGWGPSLAIWGVVVTFKSVWELFAPLGLWESAAFYAAAVGGQILAAFAVPGLPKAARNVFLHAYWALTALVCWGISGWAVAENFIGAIGAQVLVLLFIGGTLFQTASIKSRNWVRIGAVVVLLGSVAQSYWNRTPAIAPISLAIGFGLSSVALFLEKPPVDRT